MKATSGYENRSVMKPNRHWLGGPLALLFLLPVAAWAGRFFDTCVPGSACQFYRLVMP
jgi:hypothetical protein